MVFRVVTNLVSYVITFSMQFFYFSPHYYYSWALIEKSLRIILLTTLPFPYDILTPAIENIGCIVIWGDKIQPLAGRRINVDGGKAVCSLRAHARRPLVVAQLCASWKPSGGSLTPSEKTHRCDSRPSMHECIQMYVWEDHFEPRPYGVRTFRESEDILSVPHVLTHFQTAAWGFWLGFRVRIRFRLGLALGLRECIMPMSVLTKIEVQSCVCVCDFIILNCKTPAFPSLLSVCTCRDIFVRTFLTLDLMECGHFVKLRPF